MINAIKNINNLIALTEMPSSDGVILWCQGAAVDDGELIQDAYESLTSLKMIALQRQIQRRQKELDEVLLCTELFLPLMIELVALLWPVCYHDCNAKNLLCNKFIG